MKYLQIIHFFAYTDKLNRLSDNRLERQRVATARVEINAAAPL